jgi:hypothetical protein
MVPGLALIIFTTYIMEAIFDIEEETTYDDAMDILLHLNTPRLYKDVQKMMIGFLLATEDEEEKQYVYSTYLNLEEALSILNEVQMREYDRGLEGEDRMCIDKLEAEISDLKSKLCESIPSKNNEPK